jgi:neurotransmitter:Na+ symporter, NSS family
LLIFLYFSVVLNIKDLYMAKTNKDGWGSRFGLILAMAGNAVGLGNFLRFPKIAIENGGGEFIIPYLVSFFVMGIPLLWVEWSMGRFGGINGNHSTPFILDTMGKKKLWKYAGVFGIFTNLGVIAYYTYIESWTLYYVWESITGTFNGASQETINNAFDSYIDAGDNVVNKPWKAFGVFVLTLGLNIWILSKGLSGGVEKAAKIAMPTLIIFGGFLAIRGLTLGSPETGIAADCLDCNSYDGLNFLWGAKSFDSIWNFKVWLAAAGQVFFTLSVGMGTIQAYSSYVKKKDDIALNAMSAGFMNGFVEIVLGASVLIPIAVGYFGLDWVRSAGGFDLTFKAMPYLFEQWDVILGLLAGVAWFGLLFFAGVTSSLAMGTPWMGFMKDEFGWSNKKSAWSFGLIIFVLALPPIFFYNFGVFNEYDYWTGTVSLVVFAMIEVVLFAWVFGMDKGWEEITRGSDIKVPRVYKFVIKFITPVFILVVFLGSFIQPLGNDWASAGTNISKGWSLDGGSIIAHGFGYKNEVVYISGEDTLIAADYSKMVEAVKDTNPELELTKDISSSAAQLNSWGIDYEVKSKPKFNEQESKFVVISRALMVLVFCGVAFMVYLASKKRKQNIKSEQ